jgi:hypothetical protein
VAPRRVPSVTEMGRKCSITPATWSASIGIHAGWIFWLEFYGFATRRAPEVDPWFWGSGKLVDGWLALVALVVVLMVLLRIARRARAPGR